MSGWTVRMECQDELLGWTVWMEISEWEIRMEWCDGMAGRDVRVECQNELVAWIVGMESLSNR